MKYDQEMTAFATGLQKTAPIACNFKIGDKVTYTNDYGVSFPDHVVIGFANNDKFYGKFIHVDLDCYWSACKPENLHHA